MLNWPNRNLKPAEEDLLKRVEVFLGEKSREGIKGWNEKIYKVEKYKKLRAVLKNFKSGSPRLYLFGGLLRDLAAGINPRDVDLVTNEDSLSYLAPSLQEWNPRYNKFGGLNFKQEGWDFDLWPVEQTWALRTNLNNNELDKTSFASLPYTTFLNVEAIVVELWPESRHRKIYEHGFFESFHNKIVEINYEPNPAPAHCIVRSLLVAQRLNFQIGPKLVNYINDNIDTVSSRTLSTLQSSHYGKLVFSESYFESLIRLVKMHGRRNTNTPLKLPYGRQLNIFEGYQTPIHFG